MTQIVKATIDDAKMLSHVATESFMQSHGHSADAATVNGYANEKLSVAAMQQELSDPNDIYHIIYFDGQPAGYSKIIFNASHPNIQAQDVTKLERIYLLEQFIEKKLGAQLLQFNIGLSKEHGQSGMWLFVWKENPRAFNFYKKAGFTVIGSHDFHLSPTHANPNHHMLLKY